MTHFERIRQLAIGESIQWRNPALCSSMIADHVNQGDNQFDVQWVTENWEASLGYTLVTRVK